MEGGAMRGLFTAGVIDVMMENNLVYDGFVGVSAGSCFGCNYKSHQIGRVIRYNKKYCKKLASFKSFITTGDFYDVEFAYHKLPWELDIFDNETFANDPSEFYSVSTDNATGKPVYTKLVNGDVKDVEWIRASASIPVLSKDVVIDGGYYSDGGTADSVPLRFMEGIGYDRNVVILTQPKGYRKKPDKRVWMYKLTLKRWPKLIEALTNRYKMYNDELDYIDAAGEKGDIFAIYPKEALNIGAASHDPNELQRVYDLGREVALEKLEELKIFLEK